MFLTKDEEKMLKGEYGDATALAMNLLVTLGDMFEAERMIRIRSTHVSGVSYKNIGDPGLKFIEDFAKMDARARVYSTLNPAAMDLAKWKDMGIRKDFAEKQLRVITAFKKIGIELTCTCTPYFVSNKPGIGEHVAWGESSAIIFANSVLGARTNREGGPSALASAITGLTPLYGYHLNENRKPTHLIQVKAKLDDELDFSALGYVVGKILEKGVPFFSRLRIPNLNELKALGAGLATTGAIALYYINGLTPESRKISEKEKETCERITIEDKDIYDTIRYLSSEEGYDLICIGCPHCSLSELERAASLLLGKKTKRRLWFFTSKHVHSEASRQGFVDIIEKSGAKIIDDTCMVVSPMEGLGINGIITNSCKAAYYIPSTCKLPVRLLSLEECIKMAIE